MDQTAPPEPDVQTPYQVLARKYRPGHFRDLIGQEPMVRTLTNAFTHDRIAHAFILTGVRGVGKTTTARIIAKGLNCTASEGPTIDPCDACDTCRAIAAGRHVDVLEMDAASNTGVDNMREIIDSVRYRAASARYKVYVIDEVHMLSTSAFNALLKTLEEPPEHVKFIFATTEIRKVPVTVLSRCQRFDLRRIEPDRMIEHLSGIAAREGAELEREALGLITRAAEGSVRDALSLLDQAIALRPGDGPIPMAAVRDMLGLADRGRVIDLFERIMAGDAAGALAELSRQYADGADPAAVLRDLAELTHWISVVKIDAAAADDPTVGTDERARGQDLAGRLSMRVLTRAWQMLLKAIEEVAIAPSAMMAAEMAVIRLTHVAELPPPEELVRKLTDGSAGQGAPAPKPGPTGGGASAAAAPGPRLAAVSAAPARPEPQPAAEAGADAALARFASLSDVVALIAEKRDMKLAVELENHVRLVTYRPGVIEFNPTPQAATDLAGRLSERLRAFTGARWSVAVTAEPGEPTIAEHRAREKAEHTARVADHPLVAAALAAFPGARIQDVRPLAGSAPAEAAADEFLAPVPDEDDMAEDEDLMDAEDAFDPFEERL